MKNMTGMRLAVLTILVFGLGVEPAARAACTPPTTRGLVLAFDGTQVTTNASGMVSSWTDQAAGLGLTHAVQATDANKPIMGPNLNGYPTLLFDGTADANGDYLVSAVSFGSVPGATIIAVVRRDTQSAGATTSLRGFASLGGAGQTSLYFFRQAGNTTVRLDYNNTALSSSYSRITDGNFHVVTAIGAATAGASSVYADGLILPVTATPAAATFTDCRIGWDFSANNDRHTACAIAELLVYTNVLTFAERHAVDSYLGQKYGLEYVPPTVPPASDLPVTSGLQAHFDADYAATNFSGLVYAWESRTLNNINAYQETATQHPSLAPNARYDHAAVRFNPTPNSNTTTNRLFTNYTPEATSNLTVFVMMKRSGNAYIGGTTYKCVTTCGEVNTGGALFSLLNSAAPGVSGATLVGRTATTADSAAFTTTFTDGNYHIASAVVTNGVGFAGWLDGTNKFNETRVGTPTPRAFAIGGVDGTDGGGLQLERGFSGDIIAEIIYNRALSDSERQTVEAYLWDHYGPPHGTSVSFQ